MIFRKMFYVATIFPLRCCSIILKFIIIDEWMERRRRRHRRIHRSTNFYINIWCWCYVDAWNRTFREHCSKSLSGAIFHHFIRRSNLFRSLVRSVHYSPIVFLLLIHLSIYQDQSYGLLWLNHLSITFHFSHFISWFQLLLKHNRIKCFRC